MEKDNIVRTTWRIPAELYAELEAISDREKLPINTIGIERLRAASVGDRFDRLESDMSTLKQLMHEILDRIDSVK